MPRKNRRKKKNAKKNVSEGDHDVLPEVQEELTALAAIYTDAFKPHDNHHGFDLKIVPHPGDAEANFISFTLNVRYVGKYPEEVPEFSVVGSEGLSEDQVQELLDVICESANDFTRMGDVYMFSLVDISQEMLRDWNDSAKTKDPECPSLWDAMQQRINEDNSLSYGLEASWNHPGTLFQDDGTGEVPVDKVTLKQEPKSDTGASSQPPQPHHQDHIQDHTTITQPLHNEDRGEAHVDRDARKRDKEPLLAERLVVGKDAEESVGIGTVSSLSRSVLSLVQTMMERVVPLPKVLLKFLGLSSGTEESYEDDSEDADEREKIRNELLMGQLLRFATSGATPPLPNHALPVLSAHLQSKGMLPKWLQWILVQRPAFFDQAFQKLFSREIAEISQEGGGVDPSSRDVLKRFWVQKLPKGKDSKQVNSNSRYISDFQEVKRLGRGGFGVVVAAVNRLDGRQYAIKKIMILTSSAASYSRIMREVATLSRLQHPNVVRYFQAWFEPYTGEGDLDSDYSSEVDDWLPNSSPKQEKSSMWQTRSLETVTEANEEENGTSFLSASSSSFNKEGWGFGTSPPSEEYAFSFGERSQSTVELPSVPGRQSEASSTLRKAGYQTLYIQMEFCSRTLQQVMQQPKDLDDNQKWEILRQILLGLSYIHSQQIIHRDLKPANIFYSASGEIKLGDFGLAKFTAPTGEVHSEKESPGTFGQPPANSSVPSDTTGVCGTSFYIAPEIVHGWASYDNKVDMYSLGVVVFEMWHEFSTGMERVVLLRELREMGRMPEEWEEQHPQVAELIRWLMSSNPADRPTAREVLRSSYLPPRVGDEQIQDLMRSIETDTETYDRVVDGVFNSARGAHSGGGMEVPAGDLAGAPGLTSDLDARESVIKTVKDVFECHGAMQMSSNEVGLCHDRLPGDAVRVLSDSGMLYTVKYDLRHPFAEWLVQQARAAELGVWHSAMNDAVKIDGLRRFDISSVSRQGRGTALAKSYLQADLDFVTPPAPLINEKTLNDKVLLGKVLSEQVLAEAEVIKAATEVVAVFRPGYVDETFEVRVSHTSLLFACLKQIGLHREKVGQVLQLLSKAAQFSPGNDSRSKNWGPIQAALEGLGLSSSIIRHCRRYVAKIAGDPDLAIPQLKSALLSEGQQSLPSPSVTWCLEEIQTLVSLLHVWDVQPEQVLIDPLMKPEADYYSGLFFQIHLSEPSTGSSLLAAVGGRFDKLISQVWSTRVPGGGACGFGCVGVTLNLEPLVRSKAVACADLTTDRSPSDVLVCSKRGVATSLETRMRLVSKLWASGIKAEMLHKVSQNMMEHYEYAMHKGIRWLVTIDEQKLSSSQTVRVKSLDRKTEEEISFDEVAVYIQNAMKARGLYGQRNSSGRA